MKRTIALGLLALGLSAGIAVSRELRQTARPWLGIAMTVRVSPRGGKFLYVGNVAAQTPAASADLRPGDLITRFGGKSIAFRDDLDVIEAVSRLRIGDTLQLTVLRAGVELDKAIVIGRLPPQYEAAWKETFDRAVRYRAARK